MCCTKFWGDELAKESRIDHASDALETGGLKFYSEGTQHEKQIGTGTKTVLYRVSSVRQSLTDSPKPTQYFSPTDRSLNPRTPKTHIGCNDV